MKLTILTLLAICCCAGAQTAVVDPAPIVSTIAAEVPINTHLYDVFRVRTNPKGKQDLVELRIPGGSPPVDKGTVFVIKETETYLVSQRAIMPGMPGDLTVWCRVMKKPYMQTERIYEGGDAFVHYPKKASATQFAIEIDRALDPNLKSEGPFDPVLCQDGSRRSPREWVVNPYHAADEQSQQSEIRKRLAQAATLNVKEVTLREALKTLSGLTNVNIVLAFEPSDKPLITLDLQNVPIYDLIGYLCETSDIFFRVDDHAIVIVRGYYYK